MKTFKDFVLEDTGIGPTTTTSGVSGAGDNPDKTVAVKPKTHTRPRNELQARVNRLKPYGVVKEDSKKEQKQRIAKTGGGVNNPFSKEHEQEIKQMEKPLEENDLPRDADGKLITPGREESGGFWSSHKHPKGELEWFPKKKTMTSGGKTWTRTIDDTPTPKPKVDKGKDFGAEKGYYRGRASDVLGPEMERRAAEKQKEAKEKAEIKEKRKQLQKQRLEKALEKTEKPTLRQILNRDK